MRNSSRSPRRAITALAAVACAAAMTLATPNLALAHDAKPKRLVLYSQNTSLDLVDGSKPGTDHGDLFHRTLTLSRTLGGPVIGTGYTQGEVIFHDNSRDIRRVMLQAFLPKGNLFLVGTSDLPLGALPEPGWTNTYAIIGGTGRYAGAVGTMTAVLLPDGKSFKNTLTYRQ